MNELTKVESSILQECEVVIERGLSSFIDVGNALLKIRDGKLYRQYGEKVTFKTYLKDRWSLDEVRAYQLMNGAETVENLKTKQLFSFPVNEAQVRPLTTLDPEDQIKVWQEVLDVKPDGKVTAKFVEKFVDDFKHEKKMASVKQYKDTESPDWNLIVHDIRNPIELPEKLSAIITDPPYPGEYLPLWSELAQFAKMNLKEGGVLLAMSGQYYLPQVVQMLGEYLTYQWTLSCRLIGQKGNSIAAKVANNMWKPILVYRNGGVPVNIGSDEFVSPQPDKNFHDWGQSVGAYLWQVEQFTKPGDLVCDPFLGGGTTAVAAAQLKRRFFGFDINPENVTITKARLHDQEASKS